MRQLNYEQTTIVDDILYKKTKNPTKPFHIFFKRMLAQEKISLSLVLYKTYNDIIL